MQCQACAQAWPPLQCTLLLLSQLGGWLAQPAMPALSARVMKLPCHLCLWLPPCHAACHHAFNPAGGGGSGNCASHLTLFSLPRMLPVSSPTGLGPWNLQAGLPCARCGPHALGWPGHPRQ